MRMDGASGWARNAPAVLASVVLTMLPILIVYVVGRRQLLSGLTAGFGSQRPGDGPRRR